MLSFPDFLAGLGIKSDRVFKWSSLLPVHGVDDTILIDNTGASLTQRSLPKLPGAFSRPGIGKFLDRGPISADEINTHYGAQDLAELARDIVIKSCPL